MGGHTLSKTVEVETFVTETYAIASTFQLCNILFSVQKLESIHNGSIIYVCETFWNITYQK